MALIPGRLQVKNPDLSKAFFATLFCVIVCLLMTQTVITRKCKVSKSGKIEKEINGNVPAVYEM